MGPTLPDKRPTSGRCAPRANEEQRRTGRPVERLQGTFGSAENMRALEQGEQCGGEVLSLCCGHARGLEAASQRAGPAGETGSRGLPQLVVVICCQRNGRDGAAAACGRPLYNRPYGLEEGL